jgi:fumarylacetoacetate (FAA) hydrolase family protein
MTKIIDYLPADRGRALLVGRLQLPQGPTPVLVRGGRVIDVSRTAPTTSDLLAMNRPGEAEGDDLGALEDFDFLCSWSADDRGVKLLSPLDLQCVKASGVTFAVSAVERVIEERARGDADTRPVDPRRPGRTGRRRHLSAVKPGSPQAEVLKTALIADGLWSQYLEVAIGKDAEIFTKAPVLAVGGLGRLGRGARRQPLEQPRAGGRGGLRSARPRVGASLGNDVNLRDIEGRSALLLGKAKDNNASAAVGPFIRLFDGDFTMDDVRSPPSPSRCAARTIS